MGFVQVVNGIGIMISEHLQCCVFLCSVGKNIMLHLPGGFQRRLVSRCMVSMLLLQRSRY